MVQVNTILNYSATWQTSGVTDLFAMDFVLCLQTHLVFLQCLIKKNKACCFSSFFFLNAVEIVLMLWGAFMGDTLGKIQVYY